MADDQWINLFDYPSVTVTPVYHQHGQPDVWRTWEQWVEHSPGNTGNQAFISGGELTVEQDLSGGWTHLGVEISGLSGEKTYALVAEVDHTCPYGVYVRFAGTEGEYVPYGSAVVELEDALAAPVGGPLIIIHPGYNAGNLRLSLTARASTTPPFWVSRKQVEVFNYAPAEEP